MVLSAYYGTGRYGQSYYDIVFIGNENAAEVFIRDTIITVELRNNLLDSKLRKSLLDVKIRDADIQLKTREEILTVYTILSYELDVFIQNTAEILIRNYSLELPIRKDIIDLKIFETNIELNIRKESIDLYIE